MEIEGLPQKIGPVSGVASCAILHSLMAATAEKLVAAGFTAPVFVAANVPGGDEHNERLMAEHKDRLLYVP